LHSNATVAKCSKICDHHDHHGHHDDFVKSLCDKEKNVNR
jgi:hypothetical protein